MLDRRSLLVAGASSLASIMLPRVPGSANAFILPFAPTEAYADEKDPFRVLVLSRTMFGGSRAECWCKEPLPWP